MCQVSNRVRRAGRPFIAYKVVKSSRTSQYSPNKRGTLNNFPDPGVSLTYPIGEIVKSPSGPGIMAYRNKKAAIYYADAAYYYDTTIVIKVRVLATAKIRVGENHNYRIVCASKVRVLT